MLYRATMSLNKDKNSNLNTDLFRIDADTDGTIVLYTSDDISNEEMFNDIREIIKILSKYDYTFKIRKELKGDSIMVIEYCHDELQEAWGCPNLMWVTPEEKELIDYNRDCVLETFKDTPESSDEPVCDWLM